MMKKLFALLIVLCILTTPFSALAYYFADLTPDDWSYQYLAYMAERDIIPPDDYGNSNHDVFASRSEFVLYLWRAAGCPDVTVYSPTFDDVFGYTEYFYAVEWAVFHNITSGTSATTFSPDLGLTREQAFTFLWRSLPFFDYQGTIPTGNYLAEFADTRDVHDWAREAMNGLCSVGIVNGAGGYLMPLRDVSTGEVAAILYRTLELVGMLPYAGVNTDMDETIASFTIYNETDGYIDSIAVLPAYTDGDGEELLPYGVLAPGESVSLEFTRNFVYATVPQWFLRVSGEYSDYTVVVFSPDEILYIDILWSDYAGDYYFYFEYNY